MAAADVMIPSANTKLAEARQDCLDALAAHAAMHDAAVALGLFNEVPAGAAEWAHAVLGQLNAAQNATAHNALTAALNANQTVTVAWREGAAVDVAVEADASGNTRVVFQSGRGH
jgi:hypothetical protein